MNGAFARWRAGSHTGLAVVLLVPGLPLKG